MEKYFMYIKTFISKLSHRLQLVIKHSDLSFSEFEKLESSNSKHQLRREPWEQM